MIGMFQRDDSLFFALCEGRPGRADRKLGHGREVEYLLCDRGEKAIASLKSELLAALHRVEERRVKRLDLAHRGVGGAIGATQDRRLQADHPRGNFAAGVETSEMRVPPAHTLKLVTPIFLQGLTNAERWDALGGGVKVRHRRERGEILRAGFNG
jgi:hypothetical protein